VRTCLLLAKGMAEKQRQKNKKEKRETAESGDESSDVVN
jgi:hypothetical protein